MTELARTLPAQHFTFVVSHLNNVGDMPQNVRLLSDIPPEQFRDELARSEIVVVPLRDDVGSSGQMLCLQAMQLGKPIVYSDVSSIAYYFTPQSGIPYTKGDLNSLKKAVERLVQSKTEREAKGKQAQERSKRFTNDVRLQMIDKIVLG